MFDFSQNEIKNFEIIIQIYNKTPVKSVQTHTQGKRGWVSEYANSVLLELRWKIYYSSI